MPGLMVVGAEIRDVKHWVEYPAFTLAEQARQVPKEIAAVIGYRAAAGTFDSGSK
jgi:hypothetical protein